MRQGVHFFRLKKLNSHLNPEATMTNTRMGLNVRSYSYQNSFLLSALTPPKPSPCSPRNTEGGGTVFLDWAASSSFA